MTNPTVSVVIPHFRRFDIIRETVQSVLAQTYAADEIIIVDDASGDGDFDDIREMSETLRVIQLLNNSGVSIARNIGAASATSEFVAFLDSDDLWEPEKLEKQVEYLRMHPEHAGVHTGCLCFFPDGSTTEYSKKPSVLTCNDLIRSSHLVVPSLLLRRQVFLALGGFDLSFRRNEDWEFSLRAATGGHSIGFIAEPLTRIRMHRGDNLSSGWRGYIDGHVRVIWRHWKIFRKCGGPFFPLRQMAKYVVVGGRKRGGILGRFVQAAGFALYPPLVRQAL